MRVSPPATWPSGWPTDYNRSGTLTLSPGAWARHSGALVAIILLALPLQLNGRDVTDQDIPSPAEVRAVHQQEAAAKMTALQRHRLLKVPPGDPAQRFYDARYYRLELRLDPAGSSLSGKVQVRGTALVDGLTLVVLDLLGNMVVDSVSGDAGEFTHSADLLHVPLSQPVDSGADFTFEVSYRGQPIGGLGFTTHGDDNPVIWSLSEPYSARAWWPCKDTPSDKADSVDIILTVPIGLTAASNGTLRATTNNGDGTVTFYWHEKYPITTYLVSVAATDYAVETDWFHYGQSDSLLVEYYAYPENSSAARAGLPQCLDMLGYFHRIFGPYPFLGEKYGVAQFPPGGGMEHQTISSQGHFGEVLTAHELAHQWWGDKITNAVWGDIWLNEGFASYAEALYFEYKYDRDYYHDYMNGMDRPFPYALFVDDTTAVGRIFHFTVYDKGAWMVHMLRHVVGDSAFFEILLAYSHDPRFAYGNATSAGFQALCETVADTTLDWFFNAWLYQVGRPVYQVQWGATEVDGGPAVELTIYQTQAALTGLFPMPIDIAITTAGGDTVVTIYNDQEYQTFTIPSTAAAVTLALDPDDWILKQVEFVALVDPDDGSIATFTLDQNYPNPFNALTRINYTVPTTAEMDLRIYDLLGREVAVLLNRTEHGGYHHVYWDGKDHFGRPVPSGIYFYRLEAADPVFTSQPVFIETRKIVLLR